MLINGPGLVAATRLATIVAATWGSSILAQAPAYRDVTKALTVEIVVTNPGRKVPRVDAKGGRVGDTFTMLDRALVWIVGKERCASPDQVRRAMFRHLQVKDNFVKEADTGDLVAAPIKLVVASGAFWDDIVRVIEWSYGEGFREVLLPGEWREQPIFFPRGVGKPVTGDGKLVLPACMFNEPDDGPPDMWRPEVVVHQNGVITTGGKIVYELGKDEDLLRLRKAVLAWEPKARDQDGLLTKDLSGSDNAIARTWVMIRADKWAEWRQAQAVMQECAKGEVVFSRFYFAVADKEQEASPKQAVPKSLDK